MDDHRAIVLVEPLKQTIKRCFAYIEEEAHKKSNIPLSN